MNLRPIREQVYVEPTPPKKMSAGGLLHIPETAQRPPSEGTVRAISPRLLDPGYEIGDRVILSKRSVDCDPRFTMDDGTAVILCDTADILGVVEGECGVVEGRGPGKLDARGKHHQGGY